MYAVIFTAEINEIDDRYFEMARLLREVAITQYGCLEFVAATEGGQEIAISYWQNLEHIKQWKQNKEHLVAQELGRTKWYKAFRVQVVEIVQEYQSL